MELALARYEFIPESVYAITSVSTRKTKTIKTPIGTFIYKHIKPPLMFGYRLESNGSIPYTFASPEKALLDFFYFNSAFNETSYFQEMRFNCHEILKEVNWDTCQKYLVIFQSKKLTERFNLFKDYVCHA